MASGLKSEQSQPKKLHLHGPETEIKTFLSIVFNSKYQLLVCTIIIGYILRGCVERSTKRIPFGEKQQLKIKIFHFLKICILHWLKYENFSESITSSRRSSRSGTILLWKKAVVCFCQLPLSSFHGPRLFALIHSVESKRMARKSSLSSSQIFENLKTRQNNEWENKNTVCDRNNLAW